MKTIAPSTLRLSRPIEPLESRIAPAAVFHYTDVDGDKVTITSSTGVSFDLMNASHVVGGQLQLLDLQSAMFGAEFSTANITFTVVKAAAGDGLAHVGYINATGVDLGIVTVLGDLGRIDAGNATTATPGLVSLITKSMGRFGVDTQAAGGNLGTNVKGAIGSLNVKGDVTGTFIGVTGGADGKINALTIGGSLLGNASGNSGQFQVSGDIGPVKIGHDLQGGSANVSAYIATTTGKIASVTIGGSFIGGTGTNSGQIQAMGDIGPVKIGHNLEGGSGFISGLIASSAGKIASLTVGGSILGSLSSGANANSGQVVSNGDLGPVIIGHDLKGGGGDESGSVKSINGKIASVTIGGSFLGGSGNSSGYIVSKLDIGAVKIGHDVRGGTGGVTGYLQSVSGKIASVTIGGSLVGGRGSNSGQIESTGDIGAVKIGHDLEGGSGPLAGFIESSAGKITSVTIGGSLSGSLNSGANANSGEIFAHTDIGPIFIGHDVRGGSGAESGTIKAITGKIASLNLGGSLVGGTGNSSGVINSNDNLGPVKISHDVLGGSGLFSGALESSVADIASVTIGGSLLGGTKNSTGGIKAAGKLGPVTIGHDLTGGSVTGNATIDESGYIESTGSRIVSVTIGGSIITGIDNSTKNQAGGDLTKNATIRAADDLGSLTVKGSLIGNFAANGDTLVIVTARGQHTVLAGATTDVAIGKIAVTGRIEDARILAGYKTDLTTSNADAQIGAVTVGGDWAASSIAAGAISGGFGFGVGDTKIAGGSALIGSKIASITILGGVVGTPNAIGNLDQYGFIAQQIGSFHAGLFAATLTAGTDAAIHLSFATGDLTIHEI